MESIKLFKLDTGRIIIKEKVKSADHNRSKERLVRG